MAAATLIATSAIAQQKVRIGFVNTFSGPNVAIGIAERDGFELGLDHLGRKMAGLDVDVYYEDDRWD